MAVFLTSSLVEILQTPSVQSEMGADVALENQIRTDNPGTGTASAGIAEPGGAAASSAACWLAGLVAIAQTTAIASARRVAFLTARQG
ncbi:hypothetical protein [Ensifer sp. SL37]|uniref:hypothetical protein n=1 Tax=Ensifer sp. SL37 TaxID=2995137 RepID=UPI0007133FB1|nr:hypothetical protein [Ensifer sp. SL37]KQX54067.1 hypothetical protein ASD49_03145 [Ensifer sp. Root1298]KQX85755.1 hypothetical protein ASD41_03115 [Ensifer sp. Root1312]KRC22814.1 hypothetical protein ASE29_03155 [Ensifer sp. Root74]KRD57416.1 hypothetical protein ASE71_13005 [Ensifer sp. Root954]MCY1742366.1 hypothetical protein [Ensifer sp. SL37]